MSVVIAGSVAMVTGASGGLGSRISLELARRGARLALVARTLEPLEGLAEQVRNRGGDAIAVSADVTRAEDRRRAIAETEAALGPIDILVNNAGIGRAGPFVDEDPELILGINLVAPIALTREVLGTMIERRCGHVLNVSSLAHLGLPYIVDYSATKAGLVAFSTALREELRGTGVSLTVVSPGFFVDSGIYTAYETPVPWYVGTNTTATIVRKTVDAIEKDRAEVIINRIPARPMLAMKALSESVFRGITRALGLYRYMAEVAREQIHYDGSARSED